jgi:hypothetical protein
MKHRITAPVILLLGLIALIPSAYAQSLPPSMAYSSSILVRNHSVERNQNLMIAGNDLIKSDLAAYDLSEIPAMPDTAFRIPKVSSSTIEADQNVGISGGASDESSSKLHRSIGLLGVLAIAYLATRKRPNPRMQQDISELRNFPKKRLAHHEAHA